MYHHFCQITFLFFILDRCLFRLFEFTNNFCKYDCWWDRVICSWGAKLCFNQPMITGCNNAVKYSYFPGEICLGNYMMNYTFKPRTMMWPHRFITTVNLYSVDSLLLYKYYLFFLLLVFGVAFILKYYLNHWHNPNSLSATCNLLLFLFPFLTLNPPQFSLFTSFWS